MNVKFLNKKKQHKLKSEVENTAPYYIDLLMLLIETTKRLIFFFDLSMLP